MTAFPPSRSLGNRALTRMISALTRRVFALAMASTRQTRPPKSSVFSGIRISREDAWYVCVHRVYLWQSNLELWLTELAGIRARIPQAFDYLSMYYIYTVPSSLLRYIGIVGDLMVTGTAKMTASACSAVGSVVDSGGYPMSCWLRHGQAVTERPLWSTASAKA